jgi:hypothetical protein
LACQTAAETQERDVVVINVGFFQKNALTTNTVRAFFLELIIQEFYFSIFEKKTDKCSVTADLW